jgi:hypothetical protein
VQQAAKTRRGTGVSGKNYVSGTRTGVSGTRAISRGTGDQEDAAIRG